MPIITLSNTFPFYTKRYHKSTIMLSFWNAPSSKIQKASSSTALWSFPKLASFPLLRYWIKFAFTFFRTFSFQWRALFFFFFLSIVHFDLLVFLYGICRAFWWLPTKLYSRYFCPWLFSSVAINHGIHFISSWKEGSKRKGCCPYDGAKWCCIPRQHRSVPYLLMSYLKMIQCVCDRYPNVYVLGT